MLKGILDSVDRRGLTFELNSRIDAYMLSLKAMHAYYALGYIVTLARLIKPS